MASTGFGFERNQGDRLIAAAGTQHVHVRFGGNIAGRFRADLSAAFLHRQTIAPDLMRRHGDSENESMVDLSDVPFLKKLSDVSRQPFGTGAEDHARGRRIEAIQKIKSPRFAVLFFPLEKLTLRLIARGQQGARLIGGLVRMREHSGGLGQSDQTVGVVLNDFDFPAQRQSGPKGIRRRAH